MAINVLLFAPTDPYGDKAGGEQRTALLYQALTTVGSVDVIVVQSDNSSSYAASSTKPGIIGELYWKKSRLGLSKYRARQFYFKDGSPFEVDFSRYQLIVSRYLIPICVVTLPSGVPTIIDLDDWGRSYGTSSSVPSMILNGLKRRYAKWLAGLQLRRFDAFFFVCDRDRRAVKRRGVVLPNIPYAPPAQPFAQDDSNIILFVGALWYRPNTLGVDHFLEHCWPAIRAAQPSALLKLVGSAFPDSLMRWNAIENVSAKGFANDLAAEYESAAFTIAPIYFGGGSNIKLLESLAFGRTCVTTLHGAEPFDDLRASGGIVVAQTDAEFVDQCIELLLDGDKRTRLAEKGHALVSESYNRKMFTRVVQSLSQELVLPT